MSSKPTGKQKLRFGLVDTITGHIVPHPATFSDDSASALIREIRIHEGKGWLVAVWRDGKKDQPIYVSRKCERYKATKHLVSDDITYSHSHNYDDLLPRLLNAP